MTEFIISVAEEKKIKMQLETINGDLVTVLDEKVSMGSELQLTYKLNNKELNEKKYYVVLYIDNMLKSEIPLLNDM